MRVKPVGANTSGKGSLCPSRDPVVSTDDTLRMTRGRKPIPAKASLLPRMVVSSSAAPSM